MCVIHDVKKIQQGYLRVTVELLIFYSIKYMLGFQIFQIGNFFHTEKVKKKQKKTYISEYLQ